jgi:serine protease AprX
MRPHRYASLRTVFISGTAIAVALALAPLSVSTELPAAEVGAADPPTIDDSVADLITADGAAGAVVSTWDRDGLTALRDLGITGAFLRHLPMVMIPALTADQLSALRDRPEVRSIWPNEQFELLMEDTTWIVRARDAWGEYDENGLHQTGFTGAGVEVAVIDTGADGRHADFGNLVEFCETRQALTSDRAGVLCSPFDPAAGNLGPAGATGDPRLDSVEDFHHGSHVAGTVAGTGEASGGKDALHSTIGIAPDAQIRAYSANVGPTLATFEILAAYDDMTWKKENGFNDVVAVNNSWGGGDGFDYDPDDPVQIAVNAAYDAGILSVFAAGNSGPEHDTLSRQCVNPYVACVGATTKSDSVVGFSSRGRPSGPADTNRDGEIDDGDVPPDNHDRALGQALDLGLYRPALVAPGVNINSIDLGAVTCYEQVPADQRTGCYVQLNGTSMATPHVTGATAVIAEAYTSAHGTTPTPAVLTDILERSAAPLAGYGAEEQGAGRLDVAAAVELATQYPSGPPLRLGTPTPAYADGLHPGAPATVTTQAGCTGTASWTTSVDDPFFDPPPAETARFGQHAVDVPDAAERLRITVDWDPGANLYLRLWRPGVNPDDERAAGGPDRVFPDNESLGLVAESEILEGRRWIDVRAPEPGEWILRVYHRAGGVGSVCDPESDETPKQTEGFNYEVQIETPIAASSPDTAITGTTVSDDQRFVHLDGTADYPEPWDGIVTWEVPGTAVPAEPADVDTVALHLRRDLGDHLPARSDVDDTGCITGNGAIDVAAPGCDGPFLIPDGALPAGAPAAFTTTSLVSGGADRTVHSPNWTWWLDEETTVGGPMTLEWWAHCPGCTPLFADDWIVRVWADGEQRFEERISAGVTQPAEPEKMRHTVAIPNITAADRLTVTIDPVFVDSQAEVTFLYDSAEACPGAMSDEPCDSLVLMPLGADGEGAQPDAPRNVRTIDLHDPDNALRVAWAPVDDATTYEVHRSDDPAFRPTADTVVATTGGEECSAPDVPSWPTASRSGLCWTDAGGELGTTGYYRVVALAGETASEPSRLAAGTPTTPDRHVTVKVDRLFGPGYSEYAQLTSLDGTTWQYTWDRLGLVTELAIDAAARSFSQGIGSAPAHDVVDPVEEFLFIRGTGQVPGEHGETGETAASFNLRLRDEPGQAPVFTVGFRDRAAGVRIVGESVADVRCAATADGQRCEISGRAEVTRDGETTVEELNLVVEDNGTPGRDRDVLRIETDSYQGGGTLIAGQVRIR